MNEYFGKLKDIQIKQSKPRDKTFKLSGGKGLYLEIRPNGSKYWRLAYRFNLKQKTLAIGVYPVVSLKMAREIAMEAKRDLIAGVDPGMRRKQVKNEALANTFEILSEEWQKKSSGAWSKGHADKVRQTLKADALPYLRDIPIKDIKARDVLDVVRRIENRGSLDVAARVKQRISAIFR